MNQEEYQQWRIEAFAALTASRYTKEEADIIIDWMDRIKASNERELLGDKRFQAMIEYYEVDNGEIKDWSLYNSLMSRMWNFAPFILREERRWG
jgi:hypothetical protein